MNMMCWCVFITCFIHRPSCTVDLQNIDHFGGFFCIFEAKSFHIFACPSRWSKKIFTNLIMNKENWKYFFLVPEGGANYNVKMVMSFFSFESSRHTKYREYGSDMLQPILATMTVSTFFTGTSTRCTAAWQIVPRRVEPTVIQRKRRTTRSATAHVWITATTIAKEAAVSLATTTPTVATLIWIGCVPFTA